MSEGMPAPEPPVVMTPEAAQELSVSSTTASFGEPVSLVQVVHLVLGALVTLGWLQVNNVTVDALGTIVAVALSTGAQLWARSRVTPIKK